MKCSVGSRPLRRFPNKIYETLGIIFIVMIVLFIDSWSLLARHSPSKVFALSHAVGLPQFSAVMCQKSITLCNPLEVGDLNIEKVDFST